MTRTAEGCFSSGTRANRESALSSAGSNPRLLQVPVPTNCVRIELCLLEIRGKERIYICELEQGQIGVRQPSLCAQRRGRTLAVCAPLEAGALLQAGGLQGEGGRRAAGLRPRAAQRLRHPAQGGLLGRGPAQGREFPQPAQAGPHGKQHAPGGEDARLSRPLACKKCSGARCRGKLLVPYTCLSRCRVLSVRKTGPQGARRHPEWHVQLKRLQLWVTACEQKRLQRPFAGSGCSRCKA